MVFWRIKFLVFNQDAADRNDELCAAQTTSFAFDDISCWNISMGLNEQGIRMQLRKE